jgi:hypothetical protein
MRRKLTSAEKRARRERRKNTKIIFINGRQKRVPREPMIDGIPVDEFIRRNADPIWLHQNEMWEYIEPEEAPKLPRDSMPPATQDLVQPPEDNIPF